MHHKGKGWTAVCIFFAAVMLLAAYGLHRFVSIDDLANCGEMPTVGECVTADAVVAVSGGDTHARTDEAVKLYKNGWAQLLIVSGAAQDISGPSNAMAMRAQAIESGVPPADILLDEAARDTNQNAIGAAELARQEGVRNVIVVTSPYHLMRASIVFEREFANVGSVRSHPSSNDNNWPGDWWTTSRGWWLVGSEMTKVSVELVQGNVQKNE